MPPSSSVSVTPVPPRRLRTLHWFATGKPLAGKPTLDTHFTRRSWPKRVAAARIPGKPDSDGAQFFMCLYPQPSLDGQYTVFGHITEGMDVAEKISRGPVGADGMTETPVRILRVTIEKKKVEPFLNATPDEMRKAKVDWQMIFYGGAVHGFTDRTAPTDPAKGYAYNAEADRSSWHEMRHFFSRVLDAP